ncbi:MAG TPA: glucose 1-dehydrogenase [Roseiarcus sp.]|nr:glucose 1-dehydrogenase [Roseiarcus sp.]
MRLKGKVAIVTGAGSGFGAGMAMRFAAEGARVALLDINLQGAQQVAEAAGHGAIALKCDVTRADDIAAAVAATRQAFGRLDIVVNNAGWTHRNKPLLEVTEAEFDRIYNVNVKSIYLMTQATTAALAEAGGGSVINIGSTAGVRPRPGLTWYNGSKGFVNLVSKSMAVELAPLKIRVNCIAPVLGQTGLTEEFIGGPATPERLKAFMATIPLGRMSLASDIASAALYLASDEAEFITGVVLPVDGGRTI